MVFRSVCQLAWPRTCLFFLLILYKLTISTCKSSVSYSEHCGSVVPEATSTTYADFAFPYLETTTTFLSGGERILGNSAFRYSTSFDFHTSRNVYATNTHGIYKIEAEMSFRVYNEVYYPASNATYGISPRRRRRSGRLKFLLHGFWSEISGKGCFIGSASWYTSEGEPLKLDAMFSINYFKNSTYSNSFVTGKLESLSHLNDESYFEPISILSFPQVKQYEYKLISEEIARGFHVADIRKGSVLDSHPGQVCSLFNMDYIPFNLEYASNCSSSVKNCSPVDRVLGYTPTYISLLSIQCHEYGNKIRFLAQLTNSSYGRRYEMFDPNSTLVGEGLWDEKTNSLVIVGCRITSSNTSGDAHVGDCSYRLSLWFPSVWSIKNRDKALGQIWTNKTAKDSGYFDRIKLRTSDKYLNLPGLKYEYTEVKKVNKFCPKKDVRSGDSYPSGQSYDMKFDISVKYFRWGYAEPIFIGNKPYAHSPVYMSNSRRGGYRDFVVSEVELEDAVLDNAPLNVSYEFGFYSMGDVKLGAGLSSLNSSLDSSGQLVISAEGLYDAGTGCLSMVGCRNIGFNHSVDCDIILNFQFPGSKRSNGGLIKGSMKSTRKQSDPLFFEKLPMIATSYSIYEAQRSVWRIDLEIIMVLISNTLACISICYQIYYVKKYPKTLPYISVVMLVILTLGHMIPLVLNFEALFMPKQNTQNMLLSSAGWLEVNEVVVRVVTMAAFLLQFRLLQLAWTARRTGEGNEQGISVSEKKTLLVSLPIYIIGGLIAFLVNWKKNHYANAPPTFDYSQTQHQHTLWGDFRSYAGLILDGFLFPQVLLNIFQMSKESALSMPFYLGTTLVHAVPHAYDLYRANNYVSAYAMRAYTYVYADPSADFYSAAWDIIIPLGGLSLAVIIFLQQRYGGRVLLPRKFRELELYAKVPVVDT